MSSKYSRNVLVRLLKKLLGRNVFLTKDDLLNSYWLSCRDTLSDQVWVNPNARYPRCLWKISVIERRLPEMLVGS